MIKHDNNVWESKNTNPIKETGETRPRANSLDIDFRRVLSVWPFIILFAILGYIGGTIFMRYSAVVYNVTTSISIEEKQEVSIGQAIFGSPRDPFNDKIAYFKSPTVAAHLVDSLGLQYNAEAQGRFKNKDFYGLIRWSILGRNEEKDIPEINFSLMPQKNGFRFKSDSSEGNALWGVPFQLKGRTISVEKIQEFVSQSPIYCHSVNRLEAAFSLSRRISITSSKESNIINISYADISSDRAIDVLNGLIHLNIDVMERDKSMAFSQAINFIEQRLAPLGRELDSIETALAHFKSKRGFIGNSANGELYLDKLRDYDKELTQISILKSTINDLEAFINNPALKEADLSFVGINNPGLQTALGQYQQMRLQREKLALTLQDNNPAMVLVDKNIADLRSNMDKQLENYKNNLRIAEATYQSNIREANAYLKSTPVEEKELIDKTRLQNIKEALFLTLLQKREEASISKASVTVNTKVLYPPVKLNSVLRPSRSKILTAGTIIGLVLPLLYAIIKELLNRKIISKKQLQAMTNIPVIAELEQTENEEKLPFVIEASQRSMFGEQIRSLRTNINFYRTAGKKTNYILITSSVSGEGKSFLSMNLAKSYSLQGKKVALLEFDLRRPKITKSLGVQSDKPGLTSILIGKSDPAGIIVPIVNNGKEKLDFFPAGAIPPNPQELISGDYIKKIKEYLDENYEVVVIDTPPFGIVADAQILGEWADVTLVVTRFQQTVNEQIQEINEWNARHLFKSMALVFNGVKNQGYFGNKYGNYYYKRKYGYTYYSTGNKEKTGDQNS